ncbi:MAG: sigma-54 dependent transcriptional regulator [Acidobacteriota bacterium]
MATILLVDDERGVHLSFEDAMEPSHRVLHAESPQEALEVLDREEVDLLVTDLEMPGGGGLDLLRSLVDRGKKLASLVLSGHGTVPNVVEAMQLGALDFLEKPASTDRLRVAVATALRLVDREREADELRARAGVDPAVLARLVGAAREMNELLEAIQLVAPRKARVLITGENGTGKELVARAIHEGSPRSEAPFVRVNCAALPETLIESELFGHEKGAFTGAQARKAGRFERASGGTLFLDEVGELPLSMQPKLLRAIEAGEIERVGGTETLKVDVRLLAATNRDLEQLVAEGEFREDLYYRLSVVPVAVPPLRRRLSDLPALSQHFLDWACAEEGLPRRELTPDALAVLAEHSWPGNVRELRNLVERLVIFSATERIGADAVRAALPGGGGGVTATGDDGLFDGEQSLKDLVAEAERRAITRRLAQCDGHKTRAAESLGMERSHLYKKMKALGIDGDDK